jgi:lysocardiolipin and lysophospholipid acyltransferase
MYLQGRPPPSVNMYWRRIAIADMPLDDHDKFDLWLRERWYEKDALYEYFLTHGQFPSATAETNGLTNGDGKGKEHFIETEVKLADTWEVGNIFMVLAAAGMAANLGYKVYNLVRSGKHDNPWDFLVTTIRGVLP